MIATAAGGGLWCAQAAAQPVPSNDELSVAAPAPGPHATELSPRAVMPYREGAAVPRGFHVESSFHTALLASGSALVVGSYAMAVVAARVELDLSGGGSAQTNHGPLYAPLIGPFIAAGGDGWSGGGRAALIADGVVQAGGLALMMFGLVERDLYLVADEPASARLRLQAAPGAVSAILSF